MILIFIKIVKKKKKSKSNLQIHYHPLSHNLFCNPLPKIILPPAQLSINKRTNWNALSAGTLIELE